MTERRVDQNDWTTPGTHAHSHASLKAVTPAPNTPTSSSTLPAINTQSSSPSSALAIVQPSSPLGSYYKTNPNSPIGSIPSSIRSSQPQSNSSLLGWGAVSGQVMRLHSDVVGMSHGIHYSNKMLTQANHSLHKLDQRSTQIIRQNNFMIGAIERLDDRFTDLSRQLHNRDHVLNGNLHEMHRNLAAELAEVKELSLMTDPEKIAYRKKLEREKQAELDRERERLRPYKIAANLFYTLKLLYREGPESVLKVLENTCFLLSDLHLNDSQEYWILSAFLYSHLDNQADKVIACLDMAEKCKSTFGNVVTFGQALSLTGERSKDEAVLMAFLYKEQTAHQLYALAYYAKGDYPSAEEHFRRLEEISPAPMYQCGIARCQMAMGDAESAFAKLHEIKQVDLDAFQLILNDPLFHEETEEIEKFNQHISNLCRDAVIASKADDLNYLAYLASIIPEIHFHYHLDELCELSAKDISLDEIDQFSTDFDDVLSRCMEALLPANVLDWYDGLRPLAQEAFDVYNRRFPESLLTLSEKITDRYPPRNIQATLIKAEPCARFPDDEAKEEFFKHFNMGWFVEQRLRIFLEAEPYESLDPESFAKRRVGIVGETLRTGSFPGYSSDSEVNEKRKDGDYPNPDFFPLFRTFLRMHSSNQLPETARTLIDVSAFENHYGEYYDKPTAAREIQYRALIPTMIRAGLSLFAKKLPRDTLENHLMSRVKREKLAEEDIPQLLSDPSLRQQKLIELVGHDLTRIQFSALKDMLSREITLLHRSRLQPGIFKKLLKSCTCREEFCDTELAELVTDTELRTQRLNDLVRIHLPSHQFEALQATMVEEGASLCEDILPPNELPNLLESRIIRDAFTDSELDELLWDPKLRKRRILQLLGPDVLDFKYIELKRDLVSEGIVRYEGELPPRELKAHIKSCIHREAFTDSEIDDLVPKPDRWGTNSELESLVEDLFGGDLREFQYRALERILIREGMSLYHEQMPDAELEDHLSYCIWRNAFNEDEVAELLTSKELRKNKLLALAGEDPNKKAADNLSAADQLVSRALALTAEHIETLANSCETIQKIDNPNPQLYQAICSVILEPEGPYPAEARAITINPVEGILDLLKERAGICNLLINFYSLAGSSMREVAWYGDFTPEQDYPPMKISDYTARTLWRSKLRKLRKFSYINGREIHNRDLKILLNKHFSSEGGREHYPTAA